MASMAVMGIDFGNDSSYIAVPRAGGIETISNDFSLRDTPSFVAFSNRNRILGVAAKNQLITNLKNTVFAFKRLLGKELDDPSVKHDLRYTPFEVVRDNDGALAVKVNYLDEEHVFSAQQIAGMYFTKLRETAQAALKSEVTQCVISVPAYFNNAERQALLDAAQIAGLKVLRLFNETTATALTYGIYKQDLPNTEEAPRNVVFVDCGHTSLQVSACAFNKGKLKMLSTAFDSQLGGRDIDILLAEHFARDFVKRYGIDATKNQRAMVRILSEVEKLKKQMSANSTKLPLNIECFMDDKDVRAEMKRSDMEELCAELFERMELTMRRCLEESGLTAEQVHSIEIVGGSTRVPALKALIEKVFGKPASTTLNQDEAVARGCALQCAQLCPAILVRDFGIVDIQVYPIKMVWQPTGPEDDGQIEVFPKKHAVPCSKLLTFHRREPFALNAVYGHNNRYIGRFFINDVAGGEQKVKVKVKARVDLNGIFTVVNAIYNERLPVDGTATDAPTPAAPTEDAMDVSPAPPPAAAENGNAGAASPPNQINGTEAPAEQQEPKKKRSPIKTIELPVKVELVGAYSPNELIEFVEREFKMVANDRQERDRIDAKNALEEYVYELRGKLSSAEELESFAPKEERNRICQELEEIENWLYEDGEECARAVYADKLNSLREKGEPIKQRKIEFETQPFLFSEFGSVLQLTQKAIDQYKAGDERYAHIEQSEIAKVEDTLREAWKWLEETQSKFNVTSRYENPAISSDRIRTEKVTFEQTVSKILSKPKPTPPPQQQQNQTPPSGPTPQQQQPSPDSTTESGERKPQPGPAAGDVNGPQQPVNA